MKLRAFLSILVIVTSFFCGWFASESYSGSSRYSESRLDYLEYYGGLYEVIPTDMLLEQLWRHWDLASRRIEAKKHLEGVKFCLLHLGISPSLSLERLQNRELVNQ